jgi:excisionase family DNA binding protein
MSALDEPVPYVLTDRGEVATRTLLTTDEAAAVLGVTRCYVAELAFIGRIRGVKMDRRWLLDRDSLEGYLEDRRRRRREGMVAHVPAVPLLRQLELRGGWAACGVRYKSADHKALERARASGWLTVRMADELTCRLLGLTLVELWGRDAV